MSEQYDVNGDGYPDHVEYVEYEDGSTLAVVDVDGDGQADYAAYDTDGDGNLDPPTNEAPYGGTDVSVGGVDTSYADGGNFYSNWYIDTAVGSTEDGSAGYVNLGDGESVTWGM